MSTPEEFEEMLNEEEVPAAKPAKKATAKKTPSKSIWEKLYTVKCALTAGFTQDDLEKALDDQKCVVVFSDSFVNRGDCSSTSTVLAKKSSDESAEAAKPALSKTTTSVSPLNYAVTTVRFVDIETGKEITAESSAREFRNGTPADDTTRVSRRYALNALFGIVENTSDAEPEKAAKASSISGQTAKRPCEPETGGVPAGFSGFAK